MYCLDLNRLIQDVIMNVVCWIDMCCGHWNREESAAWYELPGDIRLDADEITHDEQAYAESIDETRWCTTQLKHNLQKMSDSNVQQTSSMRLLCSSQMAKGYKMSTSRKS